MLTPEARGIYRDILGHLYLKDRSGVITGSREELSRAGRCSAVQLDVTIQALARHRVANISERDGTVTIVNRRMKREASLRHARSDCALAAPLKLKEDLASSLEAIPLNLKRGIVKGDNRPATAFRRLTAAEIEIAVNCESALAGGWANDSRKWLNRITGCPERNVMAAPDKVRRVMAEVVNAANEKRIKTTPARYAEQTWKEFK
jgi:hypothetical protein